MKRQRVIEIDCREKKTFDIDWDDALGNEVSDLEIIGSVKTPPPEPTISGVNPAPYVRFLSNDELDEHLKRQRSLLANLGDKLADKGEKIRTRIGDLEYEKQRRMFQRTKKIILQPKSSDMFRQANTALKQTSSQGNTISKEVSRSTFSARFSENPRVDAQPVKQFSDKLKDLGRGSWKSEASSDSIIENSNGWHSLPRLSTCQVSEKNFYSGSSKYSKGNKKPNEAYGKGKPKEFSPYLLVDDDDDDDDSIFGFETPRKWSLKASPSPSSSCRRKSEDKVINLDEEEP